MKKFLFLVILSLTLLSCEGPMDHKVLREFRAKECFGSTTPTQ